MPVRVFTTAARDRVPSSAILVYLAMVALVAFPIFSVDHFVNQDGSAHVHSAAIMLEEIRAGFRPVGPVVINPVPVPNSAGHWLQLLLLTGFSAFTVTKLTLVIVYAGFVGSLVLFRLAVRGAEGLFTAVFFAGVIGLNWLWLIGTYSFLIGAAFMFGVFALFIRWGAELTLRRAVLLSVLLLVTYFSHLIAFALLMTALVTHTIVTHGRSSARTIFRIVLTAVPVVPFLAAFSGLSQVGGEFEVTWLVARNGFSTAAVLEHFRSIDAFSLIGRRVLPLVAEPSYLYGVFAPIVWIALAFTIAVAGTILSERVRGPLGRPSISGALLMVVLLAAAVLAPDEFGDHGGVLRPRFLVLTLGTFIAIMNFRGRRGLEILATALLCFVFVFQVTALFDYAKYSDAAARDFLSAASVCERTDRIASIAILDPSPRSISQPAIQLSTMLGATGHCFVWDNYEFGFYQFPVIAADAETRDFVSRFNRGKVYRADLTADEFEERLSDLSGSLAIGESRIDLLMVSGRNEQVERSLSRWFDMDPVAESGRVRVLRNLRRVGENVFINE